jgi:secreted protein with Ig-like and vWFA domain
MVRLLLEQEEEEKKDSWSSTYNEAVDIIRIKPLFYIIPFAGPASGVDLPSPL